MLIGRRNLSKEDRDELIRRLAASGRHTQKEIADRLGLTRQAVTHIIGNKANYLPENPIKSTSAAEELEAKQREIERPHATGCTKKDAYLKASSMFHVKHELLTFPQKRR